MGSLKQDLVDINSNINLALQQLDEFTKNLEQDIYVNSEILNSKNIESLKKDIIDLIKYTNITIDVLRADVRRLL